MKDGSSKVSVGFTWAKGGTNHVFTYEIGHCPKTNLGLEVISNCVEGHRCFQQQGGIVVDEDGHGYGDKVDDDGHDVVDDCVDAHEVRSLKYESMKFQNSNAMESKIECNAS